MVIATCFMLRIGGYQQVGVPGAQAYRKDRIGIISVCWQRRGNDFQEYNIIQDYEYALTPLI